MPEWVINTSIVLALLLSAFNLWDKIDARKKAAKEPTKLLEARIGNLEKLIQIEYSVRFASYDEHFARDLRRIELLEEGNKVTQRALLALMQHEINGNDIDKLSKALEDLNEYLINR